LSNSNIFYKKGDVVQAPFPYQEDVNQSKLRPVLLLAPSAPGGFISAFITSKSHWKDSIKIQYNDFMEGCIENYAPSYVRPELVYTVATECVRKKFGTLREEKLTEIVDCLVTLLQQAPESPPVSPALQRPQRKQTF
jgi:mRNA interferase MazF